MHIATANGYSKVVEFLLENHAAVDAVDKDLWTPAHAAACWGHVRIYYSHFHFWDCNNQIDFAISYFFLNIFQFAYSVFAFTRCLDGNIGDASDERS